jgi:cyclopropane fatty-acyl-phospholipid synthase-like methyltransferase
LDHDLSATGCRYLKIMAECVNLYGSLNGMKILEIGGGYGGLARMILNVFPDVQYMLLDFPETMDLQKRFVGRELPCYNCEAESFSNVPTVDLLISSYAFSEVSAAGRSKFVPVISEASHGYFVWSIIGQPGLAMTFDEAEQWFKQYHDVVRKLEHDQDLDPAGLAQTCTLRW